MYLGASCDEPRHLVLVLFCFSSSSRKVDVQKGSETFFSK